jgi:transcription elongation factor GreA
MSTFYMTKEGYEALEKEIRYLRTVKRPEVAAAIAEAREKGDLSENAEYHAAKEEQGHLEAKISELETTLASSRILDESKMDNSKVGILAKVEVLNKKMNKKMTFMIVSEQEANLKENKISSTSPIGAALLGRKVGETAQAKTPAGIMEFDVLEISY